MMKNKFPDNELDSAFKKAVEPMELDPSDEFWERAERTIAENTSAINHTKALRWRGTAIALALLLGVSVFYIAYLHNQLAETKTEIADNRIPQQQKITVMQENKNNSPKQSNFSAPGNTGSEKTSTVQVNSMKNFSPVSNNITEPAIKLKKNKNSFGSNQKTQSNNNKPNTTIDSDSRENTGNESTVVTEDKTAKEKTDSVPQTPQLVISDSPKKEETTNPPELIPPSVIGSKYFISAFFAPSIYGRIIKDNNDSDNVDAQNANDNEERGLSYSTGLKLGFDLMPGWSIQTGIVFSKSSFGIKPTKVYAKPNSSGNPEYSLVTSSGVVQFTPDGTPPQNGDSLNVNENSSQSLSYLSIPLQLDWNFYTKRLGLYASAGLSANFLVQQQTNLNFEDNGSEENQTDNEVNGLKMMNYGFSFGLGAKYSLTSHFILTAEPFLSGNISPINRDTPLKTYPYSFGIGLGIGYHF